MTLSEYQAEALKTAIYPKEIGIIYSALGMTGESGEVADKVKKTIRDNGGVFDEATRLEIAKEVGDVLWYIAAMSDDLGLSFEEIARMNLDKLRSRAARHRLHGTGDNR